MDFLELRQFMAASGLPFSGNISLDGTFKRYCKDKTKKKDEWYVGELVNANHFWCTFGSWTSGQSYKYRTWKSEGEISEEDLKTYRLQVEEAEKKKKEHVRELIKNVHADILLFQETLEHPYQIRKGIKIPLKFKENYLVLPLYNAKGELQTIQTIDHEGGKKFYPGLPFAGSRFVFGTPVKEKETLIAEGFATAYSLHMATGKPVICAFSAGNIPTVAKQMKEEGYLLTHAQDLGDAGNRIAKELEKLNIVSVKPRFKDPKNGKDFNDLFMTEGKDAVFNCFSFPLCSKRLVDLLTSDLPPIEWYIDDLIMKGSINVVWSPPGAGKSTFCYAMALHATIGKTFIFRKIPNKLRVLYIDGEMSQVEIKAKTTMVSQALMMSPEEAPTDDQFEYINFETWEEIYGEPIDLYTKKTRDIIDVHVNQLRPDLIFFDNLSSLTGMGEEVGYSNREESWKQINGWLKGFVKRNMGAVIVHHSNKSGSISGTGAIIRSVVNEIELEAWDGNTEEELMFLLHFNKARHTFGESKKSKLIYFDHQRKNSLGVEVRHPDGFYKHNSHWISAPIPEKNK